MDGFGDVGRFDGFFCGEVGDGAGDLEDAVVRAGATVEIRHGGTEELIGLELEEF